MAKRELLPSPKFRTRCRGTEDVKNAGSSVSPLADRSVSERAAVCWGLLAPLSPVSESFWIVTRDSVYLDLPRGGL